MWPFVNVNMFAQVLIWITLIATILGLSGVWFPEWYKGDVGCKLVCTFIVIAVGVAVTTGVFQYLGKP